ncbi:tetratricopeptide repeat protein [Streptomyces halstedii]|uniref:tetratricopeptide repeat protein n=1 Tax=Streptomyces halstedii TaxID=1944 RepID=UPI003810A7E0
MHDWDTAIALLDRARDGDRSALYVLVRLLCETGRSEEARRAVLSIAPDDMYAHHILESHRPPPLGTT